VDPSQKDKAAFWVMNAAQTSDYLLNRPITSVDDGWRLLRPDICAAAEAAMRQTMCPGAT
jgi:hypothetical protein